MDKTKFVGFGDCETHESKFDEKLSSEEEGTTINIKLIGAGDKKSRRVGNERFSADGNMNANRELTLDEDGRFGSLIINRNKLVRKKDLEIFRGFNPDGSPAHLHSMKSVPRGLVFLLTDTKIGKKFNDLTDMEKTKSVEMFKKLVTLANIKVKKGHKFNILYGSGIFGGGISKFEFIFFNSPQDLQKELQLIDASRQAGNIDNSILDAKEQAIRDKLLEIKN